MAVQITTIPANGGDAPVEARGMKVQVKIDAAASVSTWMVPVGGSTPITPGEGLPLPNPNVFYPYYFSPVKVGDRYDVTVQAVNSQGTVTLTITVRAAALLAEQAERQAAPG